MERLYEDHLARTTEGVPIGNLVFDIGIDKYLMGEEGKPKKLSKEEEDKVKYNYIVYAENYYRELLYKISKEVIGRRINPHRLRHSKAQDLMNRGVPIETIKAFLGHASISSTEVYAQASSEKIESDLKKIHRVEGEQK
jgi:site-specific recombinase XerD